MAKRRKLEAPGAAELAALEEGFAAKPVPDRLGIGIPPIAAVAGEAARLSEPLEPEQRIRAARTTADAEAWRHARTEGRVLEEIPISAVVVEHLVRDRLLADAEEFAELKSSLRANGQRLPIEVVELGPGRYGLISGWRRLEALKALAAEQGQEGRVRAIIRPGTEVGSAYAAMVEENEVRAQLTPYERGRIAVVAADQGGFRSSEEAVDAIFATASKAKRSKIRSFALIHEEIGDLLVFPTYISERNGLRLAQSIRSGFGDALREALASGLGVDPAKEWAVMEPVVSRAERNGPAPDLARGGRPKRAAEPEERLPGGIRLQRQDHEDGFSIRLRGSFSPDLADAVIDALRELLAGEEG